jgi:uncharacterized protein (TIGR02145 family)
LDPDQIGDPIINAVDAIQWANTSSGEYCNYNNENSYSDTYGYLYNWYAVNDSRKIAPIGCHIPSDGE